MHWSGLAVIDKLSWLYHILKLFSAQLPNQLHRIFYRQFVVVPQFQDQILNRFLLALVLDDSPSDCTVLCTLDDSVNDEISIDFSIGHSFSSSLQHGKFLFNVFSSVLSLFPSSLNLLSLTLHYLRVVVEVFPVLHRLTNRNLLKFSHLSYIVFNCALVLTKNLFLRFLLLGCTQQERLSFVHCCPSN